MLQKSFISQQFTWTTAQRTIISQVDHCTALFNCKYSDRSVSYAFYSNEWTPDLNSEYAELYMSKYTYTIPYSCNVIMPSLEGLEVQISALDHLSSMLLMTDPHQHVKESCVS